MAKHHLICCAAPGTPKAARRAARMPVTDMSAPDMPSVEMSHPELPREDR
ncbi:hypothetical protein [Glutamicibacter creatinolyticus]